MPLKVRKPYVIAEEGNHAFIWLGLDEAEAEKGILTNQYLIIDSGEGILLDPGGRFVFERVYRNVSEYINPWKVKAAFFTHQDPDVVGSLLLLMDFFPNAVAYISSLWVRFLPHLGALAGLKVVEIPDEGTSIRVGNADLRAIPAHFLHSPGNFNLYDPVVKVLFSGDLGAAVFPEGTWYLFVEDFEAHAKLMEPFHRRYLPCRKALEAWLGRVRQLDIKVIAPQHGAVFTGGNVRRFLKWLEGLKEVGVDTL